jgi:hypothetical protein
MGELRASINERALDLRGDFFPNGCASFEAGNRGITHARTLRQFVSRPAKADPCHSAML